MIDVHSHILPGIDDGAETLEDSLEILRELIEAGVTEVIATPHYMPETNYVSPKSENQKLLRKLRTRAKKEHLDIKIHLGNEIYINESISQLIKDKAISTLAGKKYILVELPLNEEYPNYKDTLLQLLSDGYKVVLAHPERYDIVKKDFKVIEELHEAGILLQCNLCSVLGRYGRGAKKTMKKLMKNKMIFTFGSDIHRRRHDDNLVQAQAKIKKYYTETELEQLLVKNPQKILGKKTS